VALGDEQLRTSNRRAASLAEWTVGSFRMFSIECSSDTIVRCAYRMQEKKLWSHANDGDHEAGIRRATAGCRFWPGCLPAQNQGGDLSGRTRVWERNRQELRERSGTRREGALSGSDVQTLKGAERQPSGDDAAYRGHLQTGLQSNFPEPTSTLTGRVLGHRLYQDWSKADSGESPLLDSLLYA
jgi:hypothetical protein